MLNTLIFFIFTTPAALFLLRKVTKPGHLSTGDKFAMAGAMSIILGFCFLMVYLVQNPLVITSW